MEITIRKPDDMHLHLRQGDMLKSVLPWTAYQFQRAVVMPNTIPPITDPKGLEAYRKEIASYGYDFEPLFTFKIIPDMNEDSIISLKTAGAVSGKLYPQGSTTNAEDGPPDIQLLYPVFAVMEAHNVILCIHAEYPAVPVLEREAQFLPVVKEIASAFPKLKIVIEHVSCKEAVEFICNSSENIAATVTLHHLLFTIDDMLGGALDPHLFCKPIVKTSADRKRIQEVILKSDKKFFFGSDSAPHSKSDKYEKGAAGSFTAPLLLPALAQFFETHDKLDLLENFVSGYGADFYSLPRNTASITLEKQPFFVPEIVGDVVPLSAGKTLAWRIRPE